MTRSIYVTIPPFTTKSVTDYKICWMNSCLISKRKCSFEQLSAFIVVYLPLKLLLSNHRTWPSKRYIWNSSLSCILMPRKFSVYVRVCETKIRIKVLQSWAEKFGNWSGLFMKPFIVSVISISHQVHFSARLWKHVSLRPGTTCANVPTIWRDELAKKVDLINNKRKTTGRLNNYL